LLNEPPPLTNLESKGNGVETITRPPATPTPPPVSPLQRSAWTAHGPSLAQIVVVLVVVLMLVNIPSKITAPA